MKNKVKWVVGLVLVAVLLGAAALRAQNMVGETVPQSQSVLDSYFITNAVPSQLAYWEWIDTMFYYIQSTYTNSLAAAQSAQASQAANDRKFASLYFFSFDDDNLPIWTFYETNGFVSNSISSGGTGGNAWLYITNYFSAPRASNPPVFFTLTTPVAGSDVLTNYQLTVGSGGPLTYLLTSNYFAVFISGASWSNNYWFQFYQ